MSCPRQQKQSNGQRKNGGPSLAPRMFILQPCGFVKDLTLLFFTSWVASLGGSLAYISFTPLTFTQKIVQARMCVAPELLLPYFGFAQLFSHIFLLNRVAQGVTICLLLASAGLATVDTGVSGGRKEIEAKEYVFFFSSSILPYFWESHTSLCISRFEREGQTYRFKKDSPRARAEEALHEQEKKQI
jgi:hypothetical protein